jgi:hypothetical protein
VLPLSFLPISMTCSVSLAVIELYMRNQGWSEKEVRRQILNVYNSREVSNYSKVDVKSIMMYDLPLFVNEQNY